MSEDVDVRAVVDHARGVLAERFGVAIVTADGILDSVARAQGRDVTELAAAVVASCTSDATPLPRSLYMEGAA
jgi:ANTAR domain